MAEHSAYTPEQVEALKREQEHYERYGRTDRAKLVAAELRKAGADSGDAPRGRRSRPSQDTAEA